MPPRESQRRVPRVVIVEDNPADAEMLRFAINHTGVEIEIVWLHDGAQALEYFGLAERRAAPDCDLLLLDISLPTVSGVELLQQIKADGDLKTLPVIIMSGSVDPEDVARCYRAGANSFVQKPSQLEDILSLADCIVKYWLNCVTLPAVGCVV